MLDDQRTAAIPAQAVNPSGSKGIPRWNPVSHAVDDRILQLWNSRRCHSPTIAARFDAIADAYPSRLAVVGPSQVNYGALQRASKQISCGLIQQGLLPGELVCLVAENHWQNIAGMLGILRAGGVVCMLSTHMSPGRCLGQFGAFHPRWWLHTTQSEGWLSALHTLSNSRGTSTSNLAFLGSIEDLLRMDASDLGTPASLDGEADAFLFFTSGSSGIPLGVRMSHAFVLGDIDRQRVDLAISCEDRFDLLFTQNFSAFLAPAFGALLHGASLWIHSLLDSSPNRIAAWLERNRITISTMSVSTMREVLQHVSADGRWSSLRLLSVGAEPLLPADVQRFRDAVHTGAILQNAMATTETRTYAQFFIDSNTPIQGPVPIGYPVFDREIVLVDEIGVPVDSGGIGEIHVTGARMATGYWHDTPATLSRFHSTPDGRVAFATGDMASFDADGMLHWVGRRDSMVKVRGQKVWLSAAESALHSMPGISNAFVAAVPDSVSGHRLVACLESNTPQDLPSVRLRLLESLPEANVPDRLFCFQTFPRTATGKVDRQALGQEVRTRLAVLEAEDENGTTYAPSRWVPAAKSNTAASTSQILAFLLETVSAWSSEPVGGGDDIRALGLDSLRMLQCIGKLDERFGKRIALADFLQARNWNALADAVAAKPVASPWTSIITAPSTHAPWLLWFTSIAGTIDALQPALRSTATGAFGLSVAETAFLRLADRDPSRHPAIADFARPWTESIANAIADRELPEIVVLAGYSWGGLLAYEIACQLAARNSPIAHLVLIDTMMARGDRSGFAHRWWRRLCNLPRWWLEEAIELPLSEWRRNIQRKWRSLSPIASNDRAAEIGSAYDQQYRAACEYAPGRYRGQATIIQARAQSLTRPLGRGLGWQRFLDSHPNIRIVPGNHRSLMTVNDGAAVANALVSIMQSQCLWNHVATHSTAFDADAKGPAGTTPRR